MEHSVLAGVSGLDLWHVHIGDHAPAFDRLEALLSGAERERADRFLRSEPRRTFVLGRGLLRLLLGAYLAVDPARVPITSGASGKPEIEAPLWFNLSHSRDRLLIGVTGEAEIGIDIQYIDPSFPWPDCVRQVLSQVEIRAFDRLPQDERQHAFFSCWAMKEAMTKAIGIGLELPFTSFSIQSAHVEVEPLRRVGTHGSIDVGEGFVAAWAAATHATLVPTWRVLRPINWRNLHPVFEILDDQGIR